MQEDFPMFVLSDLSFQHIVNEIQGYIQFHTLAFIIKLAITSLLIILARISSRTLQSILTQSLDGKEKQPVPSIFVQQLVRWFVWIIALLLIFSTWGIERLWQQNSGEFFVLLPELATKLGASLIIGLITLLFARLLQQTLFRRLSRSLLDKSLQSLIIKAVYAVVVGSGCLFILAIWNVQLFIPVTILGAMSLAITFAIQDLVKNLVAGIYLLVERPFRIGDRLNVAPFVGEVEDIHMRFTRLRTMDGQQVMIPNAIVFGSSVVNESAYKFKRQTVSIKISEDKIKEKNLQETILKICENTKGVQTKPLPSITLTSITDHTYEYQCRFWSTMKEVEATYAQLIENIHHIAPDANISVVSGTTSAG